MTPYELVLPSAARPHLLAQTLQTLFARVDQWPQRVLVHDDAVFPGNRKAVEQALFDHVPAAIPVVFQHDDPPIKHGPSLHWLLNQVTTEYVLYSQDDHKVVRPLPISLALGIMHLNHLNQIRFNKRDTMDKKGREGEEFYKVESEWSMPHELGDITVTLCAADHWYFQCGLWRVAAIKPVVDWWAAEGGRHGCFEEHCEVKVNQVMNGQWTHAVRMPPAVPCCDPSKWNDPAIRATVHKTFIFGAIGEPAFIQHTGTDPKDWALTRDNRDPVINI